MVKFETIPHLNEIIADIENRLHPLWFFYIPDSELEEKEPSKVLYKEIKPGLVVTDTLNSRFTWGGEYWARPMSFDEARVPNRNPLRFGISPHGYLDVLGVGDTPEQIYAYINATFDDWIGYPICILCIKIERSEERDFEWNEWGHYIGEKNPQHEFLEDEDETIQSVYFYKVYRIRQEDDSTSWISKYAMEP